MPSSDVAAAGGLTRAMGDRLDRLVGGVLSAQECGERLDSLAARVRAADEKVLNVTRLLQLSQQLQEQQTSALRAHHDEMAARLERAEAQAAAASREAAALRAELPQRVEAAVEARVSALLSERVAACERAVAEANVRCARDGAATRAALQSLGDDVAALTASRAALEARVRAGAEAAERVGAAWQGDAAATRRWAARSLRRLSQHVDALAAAVAASREAAAQTHARVERNECRAEAAFARLRAALRRKTDEAAALSALLDEELHHVRRVAQQHEAKLRAVVDSGAAALDQLKFAPSPM